MYLTGAIGSTCHGEAFSADYDLPNDSIYGETCASVGLTFFANYMLCLNKDGVYGDVMERALYNTVLGGMNLDGKGYFYVNPLEAHPEYSKKNPGLHHVLTRRAQWFACACCPPNLARMVMSIGHYAYQCCDETNTIFADLYMANKAEFELSGNKVVIEEQTSYPWDADITFKVQEAPESGFNLALRIPQWAQSYQVELNGSLVDDYKVEQGFLYLASPVKAGDVIKLHLEMAIDVVEANPLISADYGKVAVMRGPMVYCVEQCDNGAQLQCLHLGDIKELSGSFEQDVLEGIYQIKAQGFRRINDFALDSSLYRTATPAQYQAQEITLIPYYAWCNREEGEMRVWLNPKP